jgi:uncharacterized surface protein with fasciclin (FAS1) repeats
MRQLLLSLCFVLTVSVQAQTLKPTPPVPGKTVAQTLALMGIASKCYAGLKAARLDSLLNGSPNQQYTVFVPTNEAFAHLEERGLGLASSSGQGLDQHQQELLLRFHIVPGRYPTEALN